MRLRLLSGNANMAELSIGSAAELRESLTALPGFSEAQSDPIEHLQVHLWHNHAWWSLSDDLEQFFAWIIETKAATVAETRLFSANPLSRPDWLFEAAQQMKILLEVATEMQPI